jgi:hypothetical protein
MTNKLTDAAIVEKTIVNLENEIAAHEHNHKLNMQIIADRDARIIELEAIVEYSNSLLTQKESR